MAVHECNKGCGKTYHVNEKDPACKYCGLTAGQVGLVPSEFRARISEGADLEIFQLEGFKRGSEVTASVKIGIYEERAGYSELSLDEARKLLEPFEGELGGVHKVLATGAVEGIREVSMASVPKASDFPQIKGLRIKHDVNGVAYGVTPEGELEELRSARNVMEMHLNRLREKLPGVDSCDSWDTVVSIAIGAGLRNEAHDTSAEYVALGDLRGQLQDWKEHARLCLRASGLESGNPLGIIEGLVAENKRLKAEGEKNGEYVVVKNFGSPMFDNKGDK